jgi:hypothetical protein
MLVIVRIVVGIMLGVLAACIIGAQSRARDLDGTYANQDPALHAWFDKLSSGKGLCCSFADGVKVDDPDVDMRDNHYFVRIEGAWIKVDDSALILEPNQARHAIVWPYKNAGGETLIRCFIPGPGA